MPQRVREWIVPFSGRKHSHVVKINFLWQCGNIYIMDNHRAALWCWSRHSGYRAMNLLHVDRHYDALFSQKDWDALNRRDISAMTAADYLDAGYNSDFFMVTPLFRWDNYIGLYERSLGDVAGNWLFATHGRGTPPQSVSVKTLEPCDLLDRSLFVDGAWIFNIDLDYFFFKTGPEGERAYLFSESYMKAFFSQVRELNDSGSISCLTMSLSPECCGGWENAEKACELACRCLGVDFSLPECV